MRRFRGAEDNNRGIGLTGNQPQVEIDDEPSPCIKLEHGLGSSPFERPAKRRRVTLAHPTRNSGEGCVETGQREGIQKQRRITLVFNGETFVEDS